MKFVVFFAIVLTFLALKVNAQAAMRLGHGGNLLHTRLDPIVNPGAISKHMHNIVGGSNFASTYNPSHLLESNCTTAPILQDKSNYWTPTIYFKFNNGSYVIPNWGRGGYATYYNNRFSDKDDFPNQVFPFPPGFTMLAGNNSQRGPTVAYKMPQSFKCLAQGIDKSFKNFPSLNGFDSCTTWRAQINFPSCWDGKRATSDDNSHVSYVENDIENGKCPAGFKRIPSLFYEIFYDVDPDVMNSGTGHFVLSNGDTEGYSFHGDFANGWDQTTLNNIVESCYGQNHANEVCDMANKLMVRPKKCMPTGDVADEPNGQFQPIDVLPAVEGIAIKNILTGQIITAATNTADSTSTGLANVPLTGNMKHHAQNSTSTGQQTRPNRCAARANKRRL